MTFPPYATDHQHKERDPVAGAVFLTAVLLAILLGWWVSTHEEGRMPVVRGQLRCEAFADPAPEGCVK